MTNDHKQSNTRPRKSIETLWRILSEVPEDEETGFLSVAVITTRFTDEQCLPSSLAICKI